MASAPIRLVKEGEQAEPFRFPFNKRDLANMQPRGDKQQWAYDTKADGLAMIVYPSGAKTFFFAKRMDGRYRRIKIGPFPETSIENARKAAVRELNKIVEGKNPAEERRQARAAMTFGELFDSYMVRHAKAKKREASWSEDQRQYDKHLKRWANRRLDSITSIDVERLHTKLGSDHPYAANRLLALISAVFRFACKRMGWKGDNPASGIERFAEQSRTRWLDPDELPRFLRSVEADGDPTFRDYFRLLLYTGQRRENVASMEWGEVDLRRKVWTIPPEKFKGNRAMEVPLVPQAVVILTERRNAQAEAKLCKDDPRAAYVFPSKRRQAVKPHMYEPKGAFTRICERAGITGLRVHDLRRTVSSWAMANSVADPVRKAMLGHAIAKADMDRVYAMFGASAVRDGFKKTVGAMLAAGEADDSKKASS